MRDQSRFGIAFRARIAFLWLGYDRPEPGVNFGDKMKTYVFTITLKDTVKFDAKSKAEAIEMFEAGYHEFIESLRPDDFEIGGPTAEPISSN